MLKRDEPSAWIYLSPHHDDAVLSCGGLIFQQTRTGHDVAIWTVFAASPPSQVSGFAERFHASWAVDGDPMEIRNREDLESCSIIGASHRHLDYECAIYRSSESAGGWLYTTDPQVTGRVHPVDAALVSELADRLQADLPPDATLVCPLALGRHVDHQITRFAAERLDRRLLYCADYPYVLEDSEGLDHCRRAGWTPWPCELDSAAVRAWQDAVLAHRSQLSGFWTEGEQQLRRAVAEYADDRGMAALWEPPAKAGATNTSDRRSSRSGEPGLSFCVVSGGKRPGKLQRLLSSIRDQQMSSFEVIVCGDAARDPSYRYIPAIDEARSGRLGVIRNRAAYSARHEFIVFCDDDIVLGSDWYTGLRPYLEDYDLLTTKILNPDGTRHWDWARCEIPEKQNLLRYGEVDRDLYLTGGLMIVRTEVWADHPWDERRYYRQAGDVDISQRIMAAGYRAGICTDSAVLHDDLRHTQVGRVVYPRSGRGILRLLQRTLETTPISSLLDIAADAILDGEFADAADCLRACRLRDPSHSETAEKLARLYEQHGGRIAGNDDWRITAIQAR
jgi:LmbE family N-acetylglucosaminyl deacetylase